MPQRVVFFDIDGTLLASGGAGQKAMESALIEEFRIQFPFEGVLTAGRTDYGIVTEIFDRYQIAHSDKQYERFRCAYLERLPDNLQTSSGQVLPGVAELLATLSSNEDLVLALITGNYSEGAWIKLRHFRLDRYFKFGGFGDCHANRNLVAESARVTAESELGSPVPGHHCCVVGDTPADIECARSIGAMAIAVATGTFNIDELAANSPDHVFVDFRNVNLTIDRITAILH